jgi:hypothetical protein
LANGGSPSSSLGHRRESSAADSCVEDARAGEGRRSRSRTTGKRRPAMATGGGRREKGGAAASEISCPSGGSASVYLSRYYLTSHRSHIKSIATGCCPPRSAPYRPLGALSSSPLASSRIWLFAPARQLPYGHVCLVVNPPLVSCRHFPSNLRGSLTVTVRDNLGNHNLHPWCPL